MNIIVIVMFLAIVALILVLLKVNAMLKESDKISRYWLNRYVIAHDSYEEYEKSFKILNEKTKDFFKNKKYRIYLYGRNDNDYIECDSYRYDNVGNSIVYEINHDGKEYYIRNIKGFKATKTIFQEEEIENIKVEDVK